MSISEGNTILHYTDYCANVMDNCILIIIVVAQVTIYVCVL